MQYLPGTKILCLTVQEFVPHIISTEDNLRQAKKRETVVIHGVGGNGRNRLIEFETLAAKYKKAVVDRYGNPYEYHAQQPILALVKKDLAAREFYSSHLLADGRPLPLQHQTMYARQCDWFNMINVALSDTKELTALLGISVGKFWEQVILLAQKDDIENGLPASYKRFTARWRTYNTEGYKGLISSNFGNQKTRKVNPNIEKLLIALYLLPEKPYMKTVCDLYQQFMDGEIEVVDMETGELFDTKDFYVDGKPYKVSESTVKHYIDNKPLNRAAVDKVRMSPLQYATKHRPHHMRKAPQFALSKITMDDITIPFKMANGKRVWSYQVFDVASQAVIGVSFNRDKTQDLVRDSLRDMFRRIVRNGWGMPLEVEIEQHLNSGMKGKANEAGGFDGDVFTPGTVFPFVHFCAPRNPQEKRAEGFIRLKKYGFQKNRDGFQYRPFARNEANRLNEDAKQVEYSYEQIVANEMQDIEAYNNALHSDQHTYPGMTRLQVLQQNQNPKLTPANLAVILPYIGYRADTSVSRGVARINYMKCKLPSIAAMENITGKVTAYYLTDEDGDMFYAHLYDAKENPICEVTPVERYQEAEHERTEEDKAIIKSQKEYISEFDKNVKARLAGVTRVGIVTKERAAAVQHVPAPVERNAPAEEREEESTNDSLWFLNPDEVAKRANKNI